ncbi:hypothetical protein [Nostoc sp. NMS9]|uniref:hypothetical protein n=1 Tax=Nostoc sp. NMS9 TaxID=2815393 RepID=UPI0025E4D4DF|nr:hypothetical protein [Nostoc sp. NMS9]MBN3943494.1 hypothetical protein [Nostoc sp. NMS9]
MTDAINPRQFASLDYADADMYGALLERPAPGVPLQRPLPRTQTGLENASTRQMEKRLYDDEWKRTEPERTARKQAEAAREEEITRRNQQQRQDIKNRTNGTETPEKLPPRSESSLSQLQRSTPERQPLPSTGAIPPTPNGTAARADSLVEPTATPRPAILREAIATTAGNAISALPRALPQAAGRLVIPGVGAALSIGTRLVVGQSVIQAVTSTGAGLVGTGIGAIIGTAIGGPIGGVVGSMIGGTAASLFSDWLFAQNLPSTAAHLESYTPNYPAFLGGQKDGARYQVTVTYDLYDGNRIIGTFTDSGQANGPIGAPYTYSQDGYCGVIFPAYDLNGNPFALKTSRGGATSARNIRNISVVYLYGSDTGMDSPQNLTQPAPPPDNTPYRYDTSPIGNDNTVPSAMPAAGINKGKDKQIAPSMPSNNTPNGAPFFPGHGGLAPSYLPNPAHQPSNLGGMLPQMQPLPQRQSLPFAEPEDIPVPRIGLTITPSEGGIVPYGYAEVTAGTVTQSTITVSEGTDAFGNDVSTRDKNTFLTSVPSSAPTTAQPIPMSDALSPVPKSKSAPITKTPTELANDGIKTALDQQQKDFKEQLGQLTTIAGVIAGLTPAIQGIPDAIAKSPTVQAANKETTQGAVCEIAQPGGCLGNALDDSANKVNQNNNQNTANLLDKINAGANAAQLALLELMNTKLGDFIPGGISGKLQRLSSWMHLDRVLNILIWWQTLHNAYMLSANLGQTLTSAISNVLAAIGIKDAEGSPLDIGEVLGHQFDSLAKSVIGESEWGGIKAEYKKWNRIYQAAANLMNSIQSIGYSILSALEVVGSWVALIGNALRRWGEISEKAYRWMNPTPNFQNKFFTALETTENVVSQIDSVASEVLSVEDTVAQIGTQKAEFLKALGQEPDGKQGTTPPEATQVKAGFDASKLVSATGIAISDSDKEADE